MKKLLCAVIALILSFSLAAPALADGITWEISSDGVLTVSGTGAMPDYPDGGAPWRDRHAEIKKIVVSPGVTSIGEFAFAYLEYAKTVTVPDSVTKIGAHAFDSCYSLTKISLPNSVTNIGEEAFYECWQMTAVTLGKKSSLTSIGDGAFTLCASLKDFTFTKNLKSIGEGAFIGCSSLTEAILPEYLESLGPLAFMNCTSLVTASVPWQIEKVPDYAFFGCSSLESVTFGRYLSGIGEEAFLRCDSLTDIYLPKGVAVLPAHSLGYTYFGGEYVKNGGLTLASASPAAAGYAAENGFELLPDDKAHECTDRCEYCGKCTSDCTFYQCADKCAGHEFPITGNFGELSWSLGEDHVLTLCGVGQMPSLSAPGAPWSEYSYGVRSVLIEDGITSVGDCVFADAAHLETVTLPASVLSLGYKAFFRCTSLKGISLPEGIASIPKYAFCGCTSLASFDLPATVREIAPFAFAECVSLSSLTGTEHVTSFGESAFESCPSLSDVALGENVNKIGKFAFGFSFTADRHYDPVPTFSLTGKPSVAAGLYSHDYGVSFTPDADYSYSEPMSDAATSRFADVSPDSPHAGAIEFAASRGLMIGVAEGRFAPDAAVTRAQLVTVLWRLAGCPDAAGSPYTDLKKGWYRAAARWAWSEGIAEDGPLFRPDDPAADGETLTRAELAEILMKVERQRAD